MEPLRITIQRVEDQLTAAQKAVTRLQGELQSVKSKPARSFQAKLKRRAQIAQLQTTISVTQRQVSALSRQLEELKIELARVEEVQRLLGTMPKADCPVALLPVGIETRFISHDSRQELLVRVYPDTLHLDSHEPELTTDEETWGKHFWSQTWRAGRGNDEGAESERTRAWAQLAQRFGIYRAAWIAQTLQPDNSDQQPDAPILDEAQLATVPRFPSVKLRAESWTRAPEACLLPDRWVLLGYRNGQRVLLEASEPITDRLPVGPSPQAEPPEDLPDDRLAVDQGMRWLVDFDEAVRTGMALRIELSEEDAKEGFDTLMVLGIKTSLSSADGAEQLSNLLHAQHFSDGLAFVPKGTPTNNTEEAPAGYSSADPGFEISYRIERRTPLFQQGSRTNGDITATALGLSSNVFHHVWHAEKPEQPDAQAMNTALWSATWGYFLEQMMANQPPELKGESSVNFPEWAIGQARRHFLDNVRGRGPLPVLRIGRQPYGVLPVTSLDLWTPRQDSDIDDEVVSFLRFLRPFWREGLARVPHTGGNGTSQHQEQDLLKVLQTEAMSLNFSARPTFESLLLASEKLPGITQGMTVEQKRRVKIAKEFLEAHGLNFHPRLLATVLTPLDFPLTTSLIQNEPLSEKQALAPNYIEWLLRADYATINLEFPPDSDEKLNSLLYLLLRHSTMLEYANAAFRVLLSEGRVDGWNDHLEQTLVDIKSASEKTPTVGRFVDQVVPNLDNRPLSQVIHQKGERDHSECRELDEFRQALAHLMSVPTAKLERLMTEVLDVSAYRLDAWITSYATKRLDEVRSNSPNGLYIGAYGWVENLRPKPADTPIDPPPGEEGTPLFIKPDNGGFVHAPSLNQASTAAILRSGYLSDSDNDTQHPFAINLSSDRIRLALNLLDGIRQGQSLGALLGYRFERGLHERGLDRFIDSFRKLAPVGPLYQAMADVEEKNALVKKTRELPSKELQIAQSNLDIFNSEREKIIKFSIDLKKEQKKAADLTNKMKKVQQQINVFTELRKAQIKLKRSPQKIDVTLRRLRTELNALKKKRALPVGRAKQIQGTINLIKVGFKNRHGKTYPSNAKALQITLRQLKMAVSIEKAKNKRHPSFPKAQKALLAAQENLEKLREEQRKRFLFAPSATATGDVTAMEAIAVHNVVDGLALHTRYKIGLKETPPKWNRASIPFGDEELKFPKVNTKPCKELLAELQILDNALDAVSDALTAEQVYQMVQGNTLRTGITLDSVIQDEAEPPELEVIHTPRSGIGLAHRILVLFAGDPDEKDSWKTNNFQIRADAEPHLNAWAGRLLGNPDMIRCQAEYLDPTTNEVLAEKDVRLSDLMLSPLDVLYMTPGSDGTQYSELEQRVTNHLLITRANEIPVHAKIRLSFDRGQAFQVNEVSFAEFLEIADATRKLISGARPADARDVTTPDIASSSNIDINELKARADSSVNKFLATHQTLTSLLPNTETVDLDALRATLMQLSHFGIQNTLPLSVEGDSPEIRDILVGQAESVDKELSRRTEKLRSSKEGVDLTTASPEAQLEHELERLHIVLGADFRVLPTFKATNAAELQEAFANSEEIQDGDPLAVMNWFQRIARVREGATRLDTVFMYDEALQQTSTIPLQVGQLPTLPKETEDGLQKERWIGLPHTNGEPIEGGKISLVAHFPNEFNFSGSMAGLFIDEWQEVVPNTSEMTGVAFHYDRPNAFPPQAILLAVPPDMRDDWDLEVLESIALETLELLKLRSVDPEALQGVKELDQFFPALFFSLNLGGVNEKGATVSTNFTRAAQ